MLKKPEGMDECIYFTQRDVGKGEATVWVLRQLCPKCKKALMSKPRDSKGKVKTRANEYVCPKCSYKVEKQAYEDSLMASAEYKCPSCGSEGETQTPYKRKNIDGIPTLRFQCAQCKANIDITKKMKEKGARSSKADF